jgi:hypothetical protein
MTDIINDLDDTINDLKNEISNLNDDFKPKRMHHDSYAEAMAILRELESKIKRLYMQ